jgi:hypothetical protein
VLFTLSVYASPIIPVVFVLSPSFHPSAARPLCGAASTL